MAQGFAVFAGIAADIIRASAREAEALGYSSFWVNHPGSRTRTRSGYIGPRMTQGQYSAKP